jgi:hypothetical protein
MIMPTDNFPTLFIRKNVIDFVLHSRIVGGIYIFLECRSGGIGRRARFRFLWGIPRAGSIPVFGTTNQKIGFCQLISYI